MKNLFFTIALLSLLSISFPINIGMNINNSSNERLYYMVIVNGENTRAPLDSFSFDCIVELIVSDSRIESMVLSDLSISSTALYMHVIGVKNFIRSVLEEWINHIELYGLESSNEKTYLSVNGLIVEAFIVNKEGEQVYRDPKTGLYLGGSHKLVIRFREIVSYEVSITAFLVRIEPTDEVNKLNIVMAPINIVRVLGTIASIAIVVLAMNTILKWRYYRIM